MKKNQLIDSPTNRQTQPKANRTDFGAVPPTQGDEIKKPIEPTGRLHRWNHHGLCQVCRAMAEESIRLIPLLRGNVIQVGKQYTWEAWITIGEDEPPNGVHLQSKDKFMNFTAAQNDMQAMAPEILKQACMAMGGTVPEEFIDLKGGRIVSEKEFTTPKTFGKG